MHDNLLQVSNLHKTYPNGTQALNGVELELGNGMFGLLGPNGAGKSTLMRVIATLQQADQGQIQFNGVDIADNPQAIRATLGYLPQEFGVYPRVSAQRLLDYIAVLKGITDKRERQDQIAHLLNQTNLYAQRRQAVSTFSGGMRQRFGIAQALLGQPRLIIVDEPTAGLDPEERYRFLNLLSEIGEHIIVILSTHIVEDVEELCPRMAIMAKGRIVRQGNPSALRAALDGRLWQKQVSKAELVAYQNQFPILSQRLLAGKIQVRVLADTPPDLGFQAVAPDLESLYFSAVTS
ncbi:MAG: ABC transporter ATP-binding protein [Bacteroidota bacterium]